MAGCESRTPALVRCVDGRILLVFGLLTLAPPAAWADVEGNSTTPAAGAPHSDAEAIAVGNEGGPGRYLVVQGSTETLSQYFRRANFALNDVRRHGRVPPLFVSSVPHDILDIDVPSHRKAIFIKMTLPLILYVNQRIERQRVRLQYLRAIEHTGIPISPKDREWLVEMADRYDADPGDIEGLLCHVDVVPPSLALAQAAVESGWGTSRFAREGNALFGQRVFRGENGIVPAGREVGERYKVRVFDALVDGVRAYVFNLNSHPAYETFRRERTQMREGAGTLDGATLAGSLEMYSVQREAYVEALRKVIRVNGLGAFDGAHLGDRIHVGSAEPDA